MSHIQSRRRKKGKRNHLIFLYFYFVKPSINLAFCWNRALVFSDSGSGWMVAFFLNRLYENIDCSLVYSGGEGLFGYLYDYGEVVFDYGEESIDYFSLYAFCPFSPMACNTIFSRHALFLLEWSKHESSAGGITREHDVQLSPSSSCVTCKYVSSSDEFQCRRERLQDAHMHSRTCKQT